jgi:hypothetical protein
MHLVIKTPVAYTLKAASFTAFLFALTNCVCSRRGGWRSNPYFWNSNCFASPASQLGLPLILSRFLLFFPTKGKNVVPVSPALLFPSTWRSWLIFTQSTSRCSRHAEMALVALYRFYDQNAAWLLHLSPPLHLLLYSGHRGVIWLNPSSPHWQVKKP